MRLGKTPCEQIRSIKNPTLNGDLILSVAMDGSPGPSKVATLQRRVMFVEVGTPQMPKLVAFSFNEALCGTLCIDV
eukprot:5288488-Amphidinium_carterae.1